MTWDESWDTEESPFQPTSPLSVPQLGLAYWVTSKVVGVEPRSGAARAGLKVDDVIVALTPMTEDRLDLDQVRPWVKLPSEVVGEQGRKWGPSVLLSPLKKKDDEGPWEDWAGRFEELQRLEPAAVALMVKRGGEILYLDPFIVETREDPSWPMTERGWLFQPETTVVQAQSLGQALGFGVQETWRFITSIYLGLTRVVSGRVSSETLGGPIEIVSTTFGLASDDLYKLILFLGILSINLAVVNFLPIPLLDGGHMVFLIYEKLRGKPASEQVRAIAAYIGLAMLLTLMVYVFYLDIKRRILG
jgi:regulator of sigma E protease